MIKEVTTYKHDLFGEIRTVQGDNGILFIGNDIARCLKFNRVQQATKDFCNNIVKVQINCITAIKDNKEIYDKRTMNAIYIEDVINMINKSSMINKRLFEMWIKEDILEENTFDNEIYKDEYIYMLKKENELLTSKIYLLENKLLKDTILNNVGLSEKFIIDFNYLTDENKKFLIDVLDYLKHKQIKE